jgi:hypothetical protein
MPLTTAGQNLIAAAIVGTAYTAFNNANAAIGVGDSTSAFAQAQTDLQASTNTYRQAVDATFPNITTNVLTFQVTFGTGVANFAWNEWGVFNNTTGGTMLNRKQESLGTKQNTQSWQFTCTLTVNAA